MRQSGYSNSTEQEIISLHRVIAKKVRALREEQGMTQLNLALEIGIGSVAFYSNCENCRYGKHFNIEHLYKIAKALNVQIWELIPSMEEIGVI